MRIHELQINRFGVWKDVTLPFHESGVSVLYGPNEAGKSTLMRFIRGVLYGFQSSDERDASRRQERVICSGSLKISHQGKTYRISRTSTSGTRGRLEINGVEKGQKDPLMQSILCDASESLFKDVFAIGLSELQQLATLSGDEVASQIYGLSLGREGEQIVKAQNAFTNAESQLLDVEHHKGEIFQLLQELAEIDRELERVGQPAQRHTRLNDQMSKHDVSVSELKRKQANLQSDLRGYQFLNQVYEPWLEHRRLLRQLNALSVTNLDVEILRQFDEMEHEISEVDSKRKHLIEEAKRLQKEAEQIQLRPELEEQVCEVKFLAKNLPEMEKLDRQLNQGQVVADVPQQHVQQFLAPLGPGWDLQKSQSVDVSPVNLHELISHGEAYRQANRARTKASRKYKRMSAELKEYEQAQRLHTRDLGATNRDQLRQTLTHQIDELESLKSLNARKRELERTARFFPDEQEVETVEHPLPPYFYNTLWFMAIAGVILFLAGTYYALKGLGGNGASAAIIGACYSLLGLASLGISWTMKQYFSQQKVQVKSFGEQREKVQKELSGVEQRILQIKSQHLLHPQRSAPQTVLTSHDDQKLIDETVLSLRQQLNGLTGRDDDSGQIESLRRKMSEMRTSLQDLQKRVSMTRRTWTEALRRFGLAETLKVEEAIAHCQKIADVQRAVDQWKNGRNSVERQREQLEDYLHQIQQLASNIEGRGFVVRNPFQLVNEWHQELELLGERRRERTQLRSNAKEKRREASRLTDRVERMREQRTVLLSQMGVADRGEIAEKLAAIDERKTLEAKLKEAERNLEKVSSNEPELMITEEMLEDFEVESNRQECQRIKDELLEIDEILQSEYQTLGRLKQEIRDIEDDRSVASLRFDREQVADSLRRASESLFANRLANRVVDKLRNKIEQDRQPQTLKIASDYLQQLTCEKYQAVWTPLGERSLLVDDETGQSLRVEQLSSGTREQVFLALRLAMIKEFSTKGVELPLVLDDVTVNFDQIRTEAAVETLLNAADEGQQILLFTCHLHLAHLFEAEDVEPIWLPNHRPEMSV